MSAGMPCAHGGAPATGRLREAPEDFQVDEVLGFAADGAGGHALLRVEKRDANTGWVASQLAREAGVAARDVGYSGRKDRRAVTVQSYSVPWPLDLPVDACREWSGEGYHVVDAQRHGRKLRPGSHRANRFVLRIRGLVGDRSRVGSVLERIGAAGVPNYFGPQRFGREGSNLRRAREWAAGGAPPRDRDQRSFLLSAARSHLFNAVLAERVRRGDWDRLLPGEAVLLDGTRSYFHAAAIDDALVARCAGMDVHPSGPMPGAGSAPATADALAVEERALAGEADLAAWLSRERVEHERRSLRLPVREFAWTHLDDATLELRFLLPRGAFATAVLHELLADAWDAGEED